MALDEFSFYTEALTAWLASNCQDKSQLLQGKALEDAKQFVGCRSLSEQDYQFLIASQELEKQELLKQLEVARQETQDVKQQISSSLIQMEHELRTPLSGIIGFLKLIINGMAENLEEEQEFIAHAHDSAFHLLNIINDLLDVARLEAGEYYTELAPIKLYEFLTDIENFVQNRTQKKQVNLQIVKPTTQDEIITYGDYSRLLQVILRLVDDAIKNTDEGGITIVVEMSEQKIVLKNQEHPGLVKIHVANDKNKYSQYMLKFVQQMNDTSIYQWCCTPAFGLAFSKKQIEAMSGEFHFDVKELGCSTTVTISLPLYQKTVMT